MFTLQHSRCSQPLAIVFASLTTWSTGERGPIVSVWTNYSGFPTEPGKRPDPKTSVPIVQAVQPLRSVQSLNFGEREQVVLAHGPKRFDEGL